MSEPDFNDARIDEGIRLFNQARFFECHDVLEDFWGELTCSNKAFFQGLIQAAVALHHFEEGNLGGARRMFHSACTYMAPFAPETAGIDVTGLLDQMAVCFAELCQPHVSYPAHIRLQVELLPQIGRIVP